MCHVGQSLLSAAILGEGGASLGLAVVAKRVETLAQKDIPVVQGYWFAKPMPPQALPAWMVEQSMSQ